MLLKPLCDVEQVWTDEEKVTIPRFLLAVPNFDHFSLFCCCLISLFIIYKFNEPSVILFTWQVKMDYGSSKSRGFGFVNFRDPEVAKTVLSQVHRIQGRLCEVRLPRCKVRNKKMIYFLLTVLFKFKYSRYVTCMRIKNLTFASCRIINPLLRWEYC